MRKLIILFGLFIFLLNSCDNNKKETTQGGTKIKPGVKNMKTIQLTKADFLTKIADYETNSTEWKYLGDKPAIIDFYANWCGPCKMIAPILEEIANEYADDIYVYKIDVDAEEELAAIFNVKSIPTILFVPMEGAPQIAQGALPKSAFIEAIEDVFRIKKADK